MSMSVAQVLLRLGLGSSLDTQTKVELQLLLILSGIPSLRSDCHSYAGNFGKDNSCSYVQVCLLKTFNAITDGQPGLLSNYIYDGMLVDFVQGQVLHFSQPKPANSRHILISSHLFWLWENNSKCLTALYMLWGYLHKIPKISCIEA